MKLERNRENRNIGSWKYIEKCVKNRNKVTYRNIRYKLNQNVEIRL